ncbi:heparan sulfate glucosamine 3-O-sulfotransferase 3B1-like [Aplysia californica]|uniref:Heparan sulfate glucosamine 3-O-sulfotransferase 3B1-like n=1 Tax=Aplysia californica TaxID=6500 RepID=A0ABM0ZX96_APLCA|nr:heparan sulfate glucosamine 3-O-sulfotransferase 3B1-like [Aplysia californica]
MVSSIPLVFHSFFTPSSNQVTIEKTPAYVITPNAREQMKEHFPNIKLIVLVRDPIVRILSAYAQRITKSPVSLENFYNIEGSDAISENKYPVVVSTYYKHLAPWFDTFNRSQILVLNGDDLISKPLAVMQRVEEFLKIPKLYTDDNFYKNETSGFFCYKGFDENEQVHCLGGSKGRPHETLPADEEKKLYKYFRPHNEKLFSLIQQRFEWPQKS